MDILISAAAPSRAGVDVAVVVDGVDDIVEISKGKIIEQKNILSGLGHVEGAAKLEDDIILIHNLEKCLSMQEEKMLNTAIEDQKKLKTRKRRGKEQ